VILSIFFVCRVTGFACSVFTHWRPKQTCRKIHRDRQFHLIIILKLIYALVLASPAYCNSQLDISGLSPIHSISQQRSPSKTNRFALRLKYPTSQNLANHQHKPVSQQTTVLSISPVLVKKVQSTLRISRFLVLNYQKVLSLKKIARSCI
jgi:hypothetical protein